MTWRGKVLTLFAQLNQSTLGQRATDLQTLRHDRGGDQLVGGHFLVQFLVRGLIEENLVVQLVPDFAFGPLLLLGLAAAGALLLLLCLLRLLSRRLCVLLRRLYMEIKTKYGFFNINNHKNLKIFDMHSCL